MKSSNDDSGARVSALKPFYFHYLSLFPEAISHFLSIGLLAKAQKKGLIQCETTHFRDHANDRHRKVDDTPYGGGEGMLMKVDVLYRAWESAVAQIKAHQPSVRPKTLLLSPQGSVFDQAMASRLAAHEGGLVLVCGHYEGVDQRFIDLCVDEEVSVGNYVLMGGELPALTLTEAIARLIPGVLGNEESAARDSLSLGENQNLLKYPQYTRPREFMGQRVPDVLLGGDHQAIASWRSKQARAQTQSKRPDLAGELVSSSSASSAASAASSCAPLGKSSKPKSE